MGVATRAGEQAFDKTMGSHYGASTPQPQGACILEWNSYKSVTLSFVLVLCVGDKAGGENNELRWR